MTVASMSIRDIHYGNPPWLPRMPAYCQPLLWIRCYEFPLGFVAHPGTCWLTTIYQAVAWIYDWTLR